MRTTRLCSAALLVLMSAASHGATWQGWVGTYTLDGGLDTGSKGIYSLVWQPETATLKLGPLAAATSNPSFLALHPNGRFVYAANEDAASAGQDRISAFAVTPASRVDKPLDADDAGGPAGLRFIGSAAAGGSAPCHLAVDTQGRWLFVANYLSGTVAVLPIRGGALGDPVQVVRQAGRGPDSQRQQSAHAHQVLQSSSGRFLLSVDLGADRVFVYRFDPVRGRLTARGSLRAPAGSGPRHALFSADGRFLYVLTELKPAILSYRWNESAGEAKLLAITPLTPGSELVAGGGAELLLHPDGRHLYASNRADADTITRFTIGADGLPVRNDAVSSGGVKPRFIGIDPTGQYLFAANQASGAIAVFRIDTGDGALHGQSDAVNVPAPVHLLWQSMQGSGDRGP